MVAATKPTLIGPKREAAKLGAIVDDSTLRSGFVNVDAPAGHVWATTGDTHALCVTLEYQPGVSGRKFREDAIRDAIERMAAGVVRCDVEDCHVCNS